MLQYQDTHSLEFRFANARPILQLLLSLHKHNKHIVHHSDAISVMYSSHLNNEMIAQVNVIGVVSQRYHSETSHCTLNNLGLAW